MSFSRIIFRKEAKLQGRSDAFIDSCLQYAQHLTDQNLPVLFSTRHLAEAMGIDFRDLKKCIQERDYFYKQYPIKKKRGGVRQISTPYRNLKEIQRWILKEILSKVAVSPQAKGFRPKAGIKDNASAHQGSEVILNIDLLKFFESICEFRVYNIFLSLGYASNLSYDLAKLTTVSISEPYYNTFSPEEKQLFYRLYTRKVGVLPQGAPTSPALSNIALIGLDQQLTALAQHTNTTYTRYADDLTFSGEKTNIPHRQAVYRVIRDEGLFVNWGKGGRFLRGQRQLVTGLTVSHGIHVPKKYKKDIARHLHFCQRFGPDQHLEKIGKGKVHFYREWLLGRIWYVRSIEENIGNKLLYEFNRISWPF